MTWNCDLRHDVREIFLEAQHLNFERLRLHWACRVPVGTARWSRQGEFTVAESVYLLGLSENPRVHYIGRKLCFGSAVAAAIASRLLKKELIMIQHVGIKRVRYATLTENGLLVLERLPP